MYNKKILIDALKKLGNAKAPTQKKDMIIDPMGQWAHPGENTRIPSDKITMKGVNYPVLGIANTGQKQMMQPGQEYNFPGADYVDEYPQMRNGGLPNKKSSKKYSRSLDATNRLFAEHPWFKKSKSRKNKIFDPNARYYQPGGETGCPEGYAFNPKTGECIEWNPTVWNTEDESTSFDPVADIIYMNPNDRPDGMSDQEYNQMYQDQLEHEQLHRLQWLNDELQGESKIPLRMPSPVDNQKYDGPHYYNRRQEEADYLHNYWKSMYPENAEFIPDDVIYNKETDPAMYQLPWTVEGQARDYEYATHDGMPSFFPKRKKGGALTKAQKGLSYTQRMQAYDDSLALYNSYNQFMNVLKNPPSAATSRYQGRNLGFGPNALPRNLYQNIKPVNVFTYYQGNQPWRVHKYKKPVKPVMPQNQPNNFITKPVKSPCSNPITTVINNVPEKAPFGKKLVGTDEETTIVNGKKCEYVKTINPIYEDIKIEPIELQKFPVKIDNGPLPPLQMHDYTLPESVEAPQYTLDPYRDERLRLVVRSGKSRKKTHRGRLDGGQKYKWTTYEPTKELEFRRPEVTRLIPSLVQKFTGYDPKYFEGYEDEEGNFIPGELDYGNATGSKMEFKGAASLRDLMNQKKYEKEYEEYEKKLDEWHKKYEQSKKKQAEGRAFKYGGLSKFLDGGPQCPEGYTYNPETKRCTRKNTNCPEGYFFDAQEGRCKSKAYREKFELYNKGTKITPTEEEESYPYWPDDLTLKALDEETFNNPEGFEVLKPFLINPIKTIGIYNPERGKYEEDIDDRYLADAYVNVYPDLNYQVVVDPNKPKGYNADKSIYYVPDENNFQFEKFKQYKKLKEIEKENLANLAKYPNLIIKEWQDNDKYRPQDDPKLFLDAEYYGQGLPGHDTMLTDVPFDKYKNSIKREFDTGCKDCKYHYGTSHEYNDDYNINLFNLGHVKKDFSSKDPYQEVRRIKEHDYVDLPDESMIPRLDLESADTEPPIYREGDPSMLVPHMRLEPGKTKSKKNRGRLMDGKGQKYKHTTYKQTKDLEFGTHKTNRPIPALVQKFTGYDPKYYQGYDKEVGDETEFVPGEIERAEQEGRKVNFKGAATLRDLKKQKEYDRQWLEYQKQKDEVRQRNEAYLKEYGITPEEYEQYYGPFRKGGQLPRAQLGLTGLGDRPGISFTPFDFRTQIGQAIDFHKNPNYSLTYTIPKLFKKAEMAGNPLSFTIGRPYYTDAQRLTNPALDYNPIFRQDYHSDPVQQLQYGPNYQQYLQDVSDYTGTPVSNLNQTKVNQYNAAQNLAAIKPKYSKPGAPITLNLDYSAFGTLPGKSGAGPLAGSLTLGAGYAPESGFYGSAQANAYGVFGKRKNRSMSPKTYFEKGLTRKKDRAWIPGLSIMDFSARQRSPYNDAQTKRILELYKEDIQNGTTRAEDFIKNEADQSSSMPFSMSVLSPSLTYQRYFEPLGLPVIFSATAGLRNTIEGKDKTQTTVGGQWTTRPYGNVRLVVPMDRAIDRLKDLDLPSVKNRRSYYDYVNENEQTDDLSTDEPPTDNTFPPEDTDTSTDDNTIQPSYDGEGVGKGPCPKGYERLCEECRCTKIKPRRSPLLDKRGIHPYIDGQYLEDGGIIVKLTPEEIDEYAKGGYIIEDISIPSLNKMKKGGLPCPPFCSPLIELSKGFSSIAKNVPKTNFLGRGIANTATIADEALGQAFLAKQNQAAISAGNKWLHNWIQHPTTQMKIQADMLDVINNKNLNPHALKYETPRYGDIVLNPEDQYIGALEIAKHYMPDTQPYSFENFFSNLKEDKLNPMIDMAGINFRHQSDPIRRDLFRTGYFKPNSTQIDTEYKPFRHYGSFVSRSPRFSPYKKELTTIHEGTHDWITDKLLKETGQKDLILSGIDPEIKKLWEKWSANRETNDLTKDEKTLAYLANPTEVHARIMELRRHNNLTPSDYVDEDMANQFFKQIENGEIGINKDFGKVLKNDPKILSKLMNDLYGIAIPLGVGVGGASLLKNPYKEESPIGGYKMGGEFELGDEVDEATMNKLKKLGFTFEKI